MDRKILERLLLERGVKSICKELHVGKDRVREVSLEATDSNHTTFIGTTPTDVPLGTV